MYINRFVQVANDENSYSSMGDLEFAQLPFPKVLLGAPGGGKTAACEEIASILNGKFTHAEDLACGLFKLAPDFDDQILIIDGLDEVVSEEIPKAFMKIISEVSSLGYKNWLISCRAYEWRSSLFNPRIETAFRFPAKVANMGDLDDKEVVALLRAFEFEGNAEQFLKNAKVNEASDLVRNPQTLRMLSQAVQAGGWPKTKTELFLSACEVMAAEENEVHQAKDVSRPTPDEVISTAGWVCTQILMSGGRGVALGGKTSKTFPRPAELASAEYTESSVSASCKTKLFKTAERENVEPVHRTIAEFLAGRWLASQFKMSPRKLSQTRVMNYLTFGTGEIPPALRGLHAWVTSFDEITRIQNIANDPYGCLRYGDLSSFSDMEVRELLKSLTDLSETDPYFRSQDWHTSFGRSLGRVSIQDSFVRLVSDSNVSLQLKCTLMDSIQGTELANAVTDDLKEIILNEDVTPRERHSAVGALASSSKPIDWHELANDLLSSGTAQSLRISIDDVISHNLKTFSGAEIAEHIKAYERATSSDDEFHISGIGFRIPRECSDQQIEEIARSIAEDISQERDERRRGVHKGREEWLLELLPRILSRETEPTAEELWPLISRLSGDSYRKSEWEKVAQPWFGAHDEVRRKIQSLALAEAEDDQHGWMTFFRLSDISSGLHMRETDVIYHLSTLIAANDRPPDWLERWKSLVRWAQSHRDFDGSALELAEKHAKATPELQPVLDELLRPPMRNYENEHQARVRKEEQEKRAKARARHVSFSDVREEMAQGKNLGALYQAARASLGHFYEFKASDSPRSRIAEMVGSDNLSSALDGFEAAGRRDDIPSARRSADLRIKENKVYHLETVCQALCVEALHAGRSLDTLPKRALLSALSACQWGLHISGNATEHLQPKLEEILFTDRQTKLEFVKDTLEPSLEIGEEHVSGLYRVSSEETFSDILPDLAIEWLTSFETASGNAVWSLLKAAVRYSNSDKLAELIDSRLKEGDWASEEHKCAWHAAAFVLDFDRFFDSIDAFAEETEEHFWSFRAIISDRRTEEVLRLVLSADQTSFLIEKFAPKLPVASPPSGGWSGSNNPWDATEWLRNLIINLGAEKSKQAIEQLERLAESGRMGGYQDDVLHALANAKRAFAEARHASATLEDVRRVLLSGKPTNVSDLQALFLGEFERYQARIRTGQTDTYVTYWEADKPHVENYCRDRLLDGLEQQMSAYGIRVHKEGAMANETRVDLLLSCDEFDLPVEIKRQWHSELWNAACDQLEVYSENYRTDGTGVYLVIWHGQVKGKTIPKPTVGMRPKSASEMLKALWRNLPRDLSAATKLVVLDVSKPAKKEN